MGFDRLSGHGQHSSGSSGTLGGKNSGSASGSAAGPATTSIARDCGVTRAGDFAIVHLYADGWADLTRRHHHDETFDAQMLRFGAGGAAP